MSDPLSDWEDVSSEKGDEKKIVPEDDQKKQNAFWEALCAERKESKFQNNHFLNVANSMQQILQSDHIDTVRRDILNITQDEMKSRVLLLSIREFYNKWSESRYETEKKNFEHYNQTGCSLPITKCVWAMFRAYCNELKKMRSDNWGVFKENKNKALAEARKEASRKRAIKEREEMLRLGNGDLNLGAKRFSERMQREQKVSREKDSANVSIGLLKKFERWWNSSDSSQFRSPCQDSSVIKFSREIRESRNKMTVYRKCNSSMLQTLSYFLTHSNANSLYITLTQSWDAVSNPYSVPMTTVYRNNGMQPLVGQERLTSPHSFRVLGLHELGGKFYIVSEKQMSVYSLFPEKEGFHKFEHLNPKVGTITNVLYAVQGEVQYISITSEHGHLVIQRREHNPSIRSPPVPLPEELSHLFPTTIEGYVRASDSCSRYIGSRLEAYNR